MDITGYYRKFIRHYAAISQPLMALLKKGALYIWMAVEEEAFQTLKRALVSAPVLALLNFEEQSVIETGCLKHGNWCCFVPAWSPVGVCQQIARRA